VTYDPARERAKRRLLKELTGLLTNRARDPERIGQRVVILRHVLLRHDGAAEKGQDLARRLKVSESRVSQAVADMQKAIDELLKS